MSAPEALIVDPRKTFLDNLLVIDRIVATIARRHGLAQTDIDDFTSWLRARIVDSDYAIFRKFAGKSSLPTYLTVVVTNLYRDYRNSVWGRWRPSAMATRLGPIAVRLEELLSRDGSTLREAIGVLRSTGVTLTETELTQLAGRLPRRDITTEVSLDDMEPIHLADPAMSGQIDPDETERAVSIVRAVLSDLNPEDQVLVRMRFWEDVSVADIARTLRIDQKPLYRRLDSIQKTLRESLSVRGIDHQRAAELLSGEAAWP